MPEETRFAIGDLADRGGVSRRTVRYYVQEGLLPAPLGVGRGNHYGREHLDQLLRVKVLQESGLTLDEIRQSLAGGSETGSIGFVLYWALHRTDHIQPRPLPQAVSPIRRSRTAGWPTLLVRSCA